MCGVILPCQNHTLSQTKKAKSITLFQIKTVPKPIPFRAAHSHTAYVCLLGLTPRKLRTVCVGVIS